MAIDEDIPEKGTIAAWFTHDDLSWSTNDVGYNFDLFEYKTLGIRPTKHPDKTIEIQVTGLRGEDFVFRHPMPACDARGLHVVLVWTAAEVKLYLNGEPVESAPFGSAD